MEKGAKSEEHHDVCAFTYVLVARVWHRGSGRHAMRQNEGECEGKRNGIAKKRKVLGPLYDAPRRT